MSINWFPGHMHKARKEIKKIMPQMDLVIEVLDARIPMSSANPLVTEFRGDKPCIKLLNKADLADPAITKAWLAHFKAQPGVTALPHVWKQPGQTRKLLPLARSLLPANRNKRRPVKALILGIPNSGKSTVINTLVGKAVAKTANRPGVTTQQHRLELETRVRGKQREQTEAPVVLFDTPGFLWPKLDPPERGYRLAVTGAISAAVVDSVDIAYFLVDFLVSHHRAALCTRYEIDPDDAMDAMKQIATRRGCLKKGAEPDLERVADILLNEYRAGTIGRISLESPTD